MLLLPELCLPSYHRSWPIESPVNGCGALSNLPLGESTYHLGRQEVGPWTLLACQRALRQDDKDAKGSAVAHCL